LPTKPEKADSFELGLKTESFQHRLRFNVTGFYVQYKDIQKQAVVSLPLQGGGFTELTKYTNAAKMEVKGIEAELTALPMDGLTLRAVLGYQDGKYKSYVDPGAAYDLSTNPLDRTPKWQWTLDGNYEVPITSDYKVAFNADVVYTGRNLFTVSADTPAWNTYLESKTLVNGSITFSDTDNKYYLRLSGKNLTDKRYKTAEQDVAFLWTWALYGPPRSFSAEIGAKF
jgi:iron complex outermembrane receptor protein